MVKTLVASTIEIDDIDLALEEIKSQLQLDKNLLKNAIAIVSCHYEFVLSGIVKALHDILPCEMVGSVTSPLATNKDVDMVMLSIMLLTSDDAEFTAVLTDSLLNEPASVITNDYKNAAAKHDKKPSLIFAYAPFIPQNSGDEYVQVLSKVSGNVPCFGTIAVDDTLDFSNCYMIYNGQHYQDRMGMILAYGLKPKFYNANISHERILEKSATVTKSDGHVIMEVNERPVKEFFKDLGIMKAAETSFGMTSLPFLVDYNDGTPKVSKILLNMTPEGHALCAGAVPEGSILQIAISDKKDILLTTEKAIDQILADIQNASGLVAYSCIARYIELGANLYDEMKLTSSKIKDEIPFLMAYSGGEICPSFDDGVNTVNRFHNNAFVACLF